MKTTNQISLALPCSHLAHRHSWITEAHLFIYCPSILVKSLQRSQNMRETWDIFLNSVLHFVLFFSFFFFFSFFGPACGTWKLLGQRSNLSHSSDPKLLQWQHWILKPLHHKRTPPVLCFKLLGTFLVTKSQKTIEKNVLYILFIAYIQNAMIEHI